MKAIVRLVTIGPITCFLVLVFTAMLNLEGVKWLILGPSIEQLCRNTDMTASAALDADRNILHEMSHQNDIQFEDVNTKSPNISEMSVEEVEQWETLEVPPVNVENKLKTIEDVNTQLPNISEMEVENVEQWETLEVPPVNVEENKLKTILLWNPFFAQGDYGVGYETTAFESSGCSHTCRLTNNRSELTTAESVVIHAFNMGPQYQNATIPPRTSPNQIFVFFILENPLRSYDGLINSGFSFKDIFNLTYTFLNDSETDIYIPLGKLAKYEKRINVDYTDEALIQGKKKLIVWLVSHCNSPGSRDEYVKELARYVPVDIIGGCGNSTCPQGNATCYTEIVNKYMFYLAFENSYCNDYITEKTWRTLKANMVPVVLGGGSYSEVLPPKTVIDVRDFNSPADLANYLLHLQANPQEYLEYFAWKNHYRVRLEKHCKADGFCKLCEILHTPDYPYKSNYDPTPYYHPDKYCLSGDKERKAVHLI